ARRRSHETPTGVRGRCGARDPEMSRRSHHARPDLRTRRAAHLYLPRDDGTDPARNPPQAAADFRALSADDAASHAVRPHSRFAADARSGEVLESGRRGFAGCENIRRPRHRAGFGGSHRAAISLAFPPRRPVRQTARRKAYRSVKAAMIARPATIRYQPKGFRP